MSMRVVVVGGGVAGLAAARELRATGVAVTLVDRHFPLGGRFRPVSADVAGVGRVAFDPFPKALGPSEHPDEVPDAALGFPARSLRSSLFPDESKGLVRVPIRQVTGSGAAPHPTFCTAPAGGARGLVGALLPNGIDEYYKDGQDQLVNELILAGGHAVLDTRVPNVKYVERLTAAQKAAREGKKNIWDEKEPLTESPAEYAKKAAEKKPDVGALEKWEAGCVIGNKKTKKYHVVGGQYYESSKTSDNAVFFKTEDDAKKAGYEKSAR
jgi:hypothetical protein